MSDSESNTVNTKVESTKVESTKVDVINASVDKAIETYKKIYENEEMSEKEQKELDQICETIRKREVLTQSLDHKPIEIKNDKNTPITGPPTLTRFEKARIMGSRALQLSLGAPPFINIAKNISTSLEIAMEELRQRVIPIVIRRTLPNGDYQNIPIDKFDR
tara:strand:+ start:310 stop:795 length:486 start_codon:yes stop_codon:yes gene_type:complete